MQQEFTNGKTYRQGTIQTDRELIPKRPVFHASPDEKHCFEKHTGYVTYEHVSQALGNGLITQLDQTILCLIATFSTACVTSKTLKELLTMMNVVYSENSFARSVKRLFRYHLINFSGFVTANEDAAPLRIFTLTTFGAKVARKNLKVSSAYKAKIFQDAEAHTIKSRAQISQLITNLLKHHVVDSFKVRPVIAVNPKQGAIIRPAATINFTNDDVLYFEVPRRRAGWLNDLQDKLTRYLLVFEGKDLPKIVVNGEDEQMNIEAARMIRMEGFPMTVLFTHDLATFGSSFCTFFYYWDHCNNKCYYGANSILEAA